MVTGIALASALLPGCYQGVSGAANNSETDSSDPAVDTEDAPSMGTGSESGETDDPPSASCENELLLGHSPLRRLTDVQFENTIHALLGDDVSIGTDFPATISNEAFRTYVDNNIVSSSGADGIHSTAELVSNQIVEAGVEDLLGCDLADDACIDTFIDTWGARAYRRPLTDTEQQRLRDAFDTTVGGGFTRAEGVGSILELAINSPQFLYVAELGLRDGAAPGDIVPLNDYERASRLSYLLWNAPPDDTLWEAAESGALSTTEDIEEHARRMLADPRSGRAMAGFVEDLTNLQRLGDTQKSGDEYPQWDEDLEGSVREELGRYTAMILDSDTPTLANLLTSTNAMVDEHLAALYGVEDAVPAGTWAQVRLDPDQRAGFLTSASFLAGHGNAVTTDPVARGAFVRTELLCAVLEIPPDLMDDLPPYDPSVSVREQLEQHRVDPACSGCHAQMDPIGFGFENYDAIGRWRTTEGNDIPVDANGELALAGEVSGEFDGAVELAHKLAQSQLVRDCVATQAYRYMVARNETEEDECSILQVQQAFDDSDGDMVELMVALTTTDAFLNLKVAD